MNKFSWLDELPQLELPGNCINVEITEGLLLKNSAIVQEYLLEFCNNGIEVSIDDFGTGFSSLSYLKKFDIDYLKIDHSFINQLIDSETDRTLVEATIVIAHKLDIKTIAKEWRRRSSRICWLISAVIMCKAFFIQNLSRRRYLRSCLLSGRAGLDNNRPEFSLFWKLH